LFKQFGGERIQMMMKQLGVEQQEMLEHPMISKSLENAQRKLEKKVGTEHLANSPEEWFRKNSIE
jgi:preprotein translocase subunit SecA